MALSTPRVRPLAADDWPAAARIYAEGIAGRNATFETRVPDWESWNRHHLGDHRFVVEQEGEVVGWVALSPASGRHVYRGVAEVSVYVAGSARGRGLGRLLLERVIRSSERAGLWTLQTAIFPENEASIRLHERLGFRVVGTRERIGRHHGAWRDTVVLERRSPLV